VTEKDVQRAIVEALVWDGWLVMEINQGAMTSRPTGEKAYIRFAVWQALGIDQQDSGISDVIADKQVDEVLYYQDGITGEFIPFDKEVCIHLAVECKATGKGDKLKYALRGIGREENVLFQKLDKREKNQARFLWSVQDHGGTAIVADDLDDLVQAGVLERIELQ
jgi:hypothetical protein